MSRSDKSAKKKNRAKNIPIIASIVAVFLATAGFAYANVVMQAPKEIVEEDGTLYCIDGHGDKKTSGWIDFEENRYYADEDGALYADILAKIDGDSYIFGSDGTLQKGIFKFHDGIYSAQDNGKLVKTEGWEEHDGDTYYNYGTGLLVSSNMKEIDGETYYLNPDGILTRDDVFEFGDLKYYSDPDGKIVKNQLLEHGGNKYYAGPTGAFIKNTFTPYEDYYFYINDDSTIAKEPVTLENGYEIVPDPLTGAISEKEYKISQSEYIYNGKATYIKADIGSQTMIFVKDGELVLSSYIVSGKAGKFDTPRGTFSILHKGRNVQLKGEVTVKGEYEDVPLSDAEIARLRAQAEAQGKDPDSVPTTKKEPKKEEWDVTVNYWMAFVGGMYGFHDATWRSYFGGYIYTYDGSHGCVNLPLWAAETLYNNVEVGTPVFIN